MSIDLTSWALPQVRRILPIDDHSLQEIISYSVSLSKQAGAEHLRNLLGDSPQALEFISSFNSRRPDIATAKSPQPSETAETARSQSTHDNNPRRGNREHEKPKGPFQDAHLVRRPENHGQMATALQGPDLMHQSFPSPTYHQDPSPGLNPKLPPSASGSLISDLPNIKTKYSRRVTRKSDSSKSHEPTITSSINDLTSAISSLELSTNPSISTERRKCPCNASIHPLFESAPNCLACGKIICALEGLQPCSFCGNPIFSKETTQVMIRALRDERGQEKMAANNATASSSGRAQSRSRSDGAKPKTSDDPASAAAGKARAHRDQLLAFQRENAQRTRVHDEAADFDLTVAPGATQWMSPVQRAAALKKQQRYLRDLEEANKPDWQKKKTIMSMSIVSGKLVRTYATVKNPASQKSEASEDMKDQNEEDDRSSGQTGGRLNENPLLSRDGGGFIRPIWKASDNQAGKSEAKQDTERQDTWRRVQDDHDDNEQW